MDTILHLCKNEMDTIIQSNYINLAVVAQLLPNSTLVPMTCYNKLLIHTMFDSSNFDSNDKYANSVISKTGHSIIYHPNGQKYEECDYVDGKENGHSILWHDNGLKCKECDYVDGKENGHYIKWYDNGLKRYECDYVDGKENGHYIKWYDNGLKRYECDYVDGKRKWAFYFMAR